MGMFGPDYGNMQPAKVAETPDFIGAARTQTYNNIANKNRQQQRQMEILRGTADIGSKAWDKYGEYKKANPDGSVGKWAKGGWDNVTSGFGAGGAAASAPATMAGGAATGSIASAPMAASMAGPATAGGAATAAGAAGAGGGGAMGALASNPVGWAALAALAAWSFMDKRES